MTTYNKTCPLNPVVRKTLPLLAGLVLATACEAPGLVTAGNSDVLVLGQVAAPSPIPSGPTSASVDPSQAVCNPLDGSTPGVNSEGQGLIGTMKYFPNCQVGMYNGIRDFMQKADSVDAQLFFNRLYVPTRAFDAGFTTQDGTTLKTPAGDTLYEFFSLSFDSVIHLGPNQAPGLYQFGILSDDGSILQLDTDGTGLRDFVSNDGDHATQMACASSAIQMDADTRIPMHLDYYQGPRYHIALILVWRRVADDSKKSLSDAGCGQSGNGYWFDSTQVPSAPQKPWNDLISRGWAPLDTDNYDLPETSAPNPCVNPTPSPSPTASASPAPSPIVSASPEPSPTVSASPTPSQSASPDPSPTPTVDPSPTPTCSGPFCGGGLTGT